MEKVNWRYESNKGYGYVTSIAGVVIKRNPKTVRIAVLNLRTNTIEYKNVKSENLTPRETPVPELDKIIAEHKGE